LRQRFDYSHRSLGEARRIVPVCPLVSKTEMVEAAVERAYRY
jgi:hypothetical protein